MSDEEISSDENFANELVKAGLKIKRKRVSKSKVQKTKKKPGIDQTQHAELANIEHLPFIEKIGNKYFHLNSETQPQSEKNTLHNSSVLFGANQQIDITVLSCVPLQTTSLTSAVKPCNILSKSIREDPPVLQDSSPYLIDAPVAIQPSLLLDELSPCFIESPAAVQFNSTGEDCSEFPIQRECLPSLLDAPAVTQSNTESSNSPNLLVVPAVNRPCTSFNLESSNSPEVPAANQPCLSFNQEPSNSPEVPDANQSCSSLDPEPSNSPSLLEVPSANQSCSPLASNSPEVPAANQPCSSFNQEPSNSPEIPAAYQSCSSFDPELSNSNSPSLLEVPSANQSCSPSAIPLLDNDNENSNNRVSIISDIPYHGDLTQNKKRKSKATKDPKLWQRNITKEKREKGESYLGYRRDKNVGSTKFKVKHDVFKPARSMKPTCTSSFCVKSKLRACNSILDTSREQLFKTFWKNMSWEQRRAYICCHVSKCEKKITKNPTSIRNESRAYFLTIENVRYQVCKKMFLATLGIKDWFVRYWLDKTDCAMPPDVKNSQIKKKGPEKSAAKQFAIDFLGKLPKMPSHYCRGCTSKEYLEPIYNNMVELWNVYKNACEANSEQCLSRKTFTLIFEKLNLSIYHPKKDQCDVCWSYKVGNLSEEEYNTHLIKKNRARAEKATDKLFAQTGQCHVFTQDVESVKMVPFLHASAIYYKTKLCVHNFTIYNLASQEVMCYWFDESNSTLEASVFASCLVEHLSNILIKKSLPVILYSDGCCAQNRNAILSSALLRLSIEKKIVITQKYLEKGHTQMECDSVHSAIECKVRGKEIYSPEQYVNFTMKARSPLPYESKLLDFTFFTDFSKNLIYKSIRPGKKLGDPVVTDLRLLQYSPDGLIRYKVCFDDELRLLPLRPTPLHRIKPIRELPKLYTQRLAIPVRKYKDLQDLKTVIPERFHTFYDQLPYSA